MTPQQFAQRKAFAWHQGDHRSRIGCRRRLARCGVYIAVLATLRLEFARTTAFALGIVEMAKFPIIRILGPMVAATLGEDLAHWTQTLVETALTFFAVVFAWFLQMIISAFYSGLRGGKMFADALIAFLVEKDLMDKVPLIQQPFDPTSRTLDEAIATASPLRLLVPDLHPVHLLLPAQYRLPLTIIEWFLRFQISMESTAL